MMMDPIGAARSVLFVPSTNDRFIRKAAQSEADLVCLDLEDSVPLEEKENARTKASESIQKLAAKQLVCIRINAADTGLLERDLITLVSAELSCVMPPKVEGPEAIERIDAYLAILEQERALESGTIRIMPLIETPIGVLRAAEIAASSRRISGVAFGAEDYCAELGVKRTRQGDEILWARSQIVASCVATGISAIDAAEVEYKDTEYLEEATLKGRGLGFNGKLLIHPRQVEVANRIFAPSTDELHEAEQLIEVFEKEALRKGRAAIQYKNKMIDSVHYRKAQRVLHQASLRQDE